MGSVDGPGLHLPPDQQRIRAKCFHRKGKFIPFEREAIEQSIPARFEQTASRYPDRLAVKMDRQALSYNELNQEANRIAHEILRRQGKRQVPVVLLMDHGIPMIAAILGVLKSGNSYVPFETAYPQARLAAMLEDVQASLIVTNTQQEGLACELATDYTAVLNVDHIAVKGSSSNPDVTVSPEALAYILYTSGSTGQPKGVYQNHRNTLHMVMRYTNNYHVCTDDRIALLRSFGTNGGVLHTFGALFNGASVFPFDLKQFGVNQLSRWLSQEEITLCSMGPTTFRQLAVFLQGNASFPELRALNLSGEPAYRRDIEMGLEHFSKDCVFVNTWGATEASSATQYFMDRETQISRSVVPVGYAVPDMMIAVCDENGQEVGANQIGEIRVSSRYLSLGYWRRPDLTCERFSSSPQGGDTRIYHTGDLGYMLPDRCLVHLGRQDFQVKVRGFRVEIAEVEGGLLEVDNVKEAIVIVREDQPGNQRLVAYFVPRSHPAPTNSELRRALAKTLPVHMIPSAFVVLDKLPCLPSGKIDRSALPEPSTARPALETPFVAPRLPIEEELVKVWAEMLHLEHVGIHDNFFEMGGHSLLAFRVCVQIEKELGVQVPLATLYNVPTVEQLAKALRQEGRVLRWSRLRPIRSGGARPSFFMHHGTEILAQGSGVDQPFYLLEPHGIDGRRAPRTVEEMAADYLQEIRTIQPEGPYYLGGYSLGGLVAYETAQQLKRQGQDVGLLLLLDPSPPRQWVGIMARESTPRVPARSGRPGHFQNRIRVGWSQLLSESLSGRKRWLIAGLKWRLAGVMDRATKAAKEFVCTICLGLGRRVPPSLRIFNFLRAGRKAARRYEAQPYPGQIVLLQAENGIGKVDHIWRSLAAEGLVVHELPGTHLGIIQGAVSTLWADQLAACLDEAQSEKIFRPGGSMLALEPGEDSTEKVDHPTSLTWESSPPASKWVLRGPHSPRGGTCFYDFGLNSANHQPFC